MIEKLIDDTTEGNMNMQNKEMYREYRNLKSKGN